jgi:hypothetical protein
MHNDKKAGKGAKHGKGAMGEIDGLGGLMDYDQSKRRQSVDCAEFNSRNQNLP